MKTAAAIAALVVLGAYLTLMGRDPAYGLMYPRGGIVTLSISLLLANAGVWLGTNPERSLRRRFELTVAGWIWLLVQASLLIWMCATAQPAA